MNSSPDRLDRIESLLERSIVESDERMTRMEQRLDQSTKASDERLTRIEQLVESNNRFLSAFTQDIQRYTATLENLAHRMDGVIATGNQGRMETNTRLGSIQRQLSAIARHLGMQ